MGEGHTWWGDRPTGAPPPSWLLYLAASYTQTVHGWDPGGPGSAGGLGLWPVREAVWCSDPWQLRHSHSTCLRRCGRSPARRGHGTDWRWWWAGGCCCCGMTWWQPLSAVDHTPGALYEMQALSVNKERGQSSMWAGEQTNAVSREMNSVPL